ncbi:MAG: threonine--tRNA ligase, partial [Isosphaeraceae bacterium]
MGLPFFVGTGEAAFYGPKVDFMVRDCIGREWQLGTVQLDYVLPERFSLEYIGQDNHTHRPVMIHRAPFGSLERFLAILIEHFAGAFPLWLAPEQVRVLPISDKVADYARAVLETLLAAGFRATLDHRPEKINAKIRDAQLGKIPAMLVVGVKEAEQEAVSYRDRTAGDLGAMPLAQAIDRLKQEADARIVPPATASPAPAAAEEGGEQHTY